MGCPMEYDVYIQTCPTRLVLDRLADKWAVLVLGKLDEQPVRFNQLKREIDGISQKVLSQTLKKLERDGLVSRSVFATVPVTVEYAITPLGRTLTSTVAALTRWAEENIEAVRRLRPASLPLAQRRLWPGREDQATSLRPMPQGSTRLWPLPLRLTAISSVSSFASAVVSSPGSLYWIV